MAMDQEGIMALPEADQAAAPMLSLEDSYDAVKSALREARPDAAADMDAAMQEMLTDVQEMSDEEIDAMINVVQQMHDNPEQYPQLRAQLIADGQADEEDLPPEYDPEFLAMALSVLMEAKRSRMSPASQTPQGFAKGGIASAAESLAKKGRYGDTMLAHITPREAQMLRKKGGSGTINPKTGLPEFFLKKLFKSVGRAVKKFLGTKVGKIIGTIALATFLGPVVGTTLAMPLASAGTTLAAGGNLKDAVKSAAFAYIAGPGNPVSEYVSGTVGQMTGLTGTALQAATSGVIGTGVGLLSGQKFGDAVKAGFTSAAMTAGSQMLGGPGSRTEPAPVEDRGTMLSPLSQTAADVAQQPGISNTPIEGVTAGVGPTLGRGPDLGQLRAPVPGLPETAAEGAIPGGFRPYTAEQAVGAQAEPGALAGVQPGAAQATAAKPESMLGQAKDWISKNIMPSGIQEQGIPAAQEAGAKAMEALRARVPNATPAMLESAYQTAYKAAMPGMLATYGPITAAGIGALGMAGGFKAKPIVLSQEAKDMQARLDRERKMMEENPGMFTPKGLERFGAVYNDKGQIVSWNPWTPESAGAFTQYQTPRSSSMYSGVASLMPTTRMAQGGIVGYAYGGPVSDITSAYKQTVGSGDPNWTEARFVQEAKEKYGATDDQLRAAQQQILGERIQTNLAAAEQFQAAKNAALNTAGTNTTNSTSAGGLTIPANVYSATPEQKGAYYNTLLGLGYTDAEIRKAAGVQSGAEWADLQNIAANLRQTSGTNTTNSTSAGGLTIPANVYNATPEQKGAYYNTLLGLGYTDAQIRAAAGVQSDAEWKDLTGIATRLRTTTTNPNAELLNKFNTLYDQYNALQAQINQLLAKSNPTSVSSTPWNISPGFSNYQAATVGTPITPTSSVLGGQVLGLSDPFAAGKISPLQYLVPQPYNTTSMYGNIMGNQQKPAAVMAQGGIANLGKGGYPRRTGQIDGPGTETSDEIPAMLSDGEFVMTAKAVRGAGGGSRREGAKKMYALMHRLEKNAARG